VSGHSAACWRKPSVKEMSATMMFAKCGATSESALRSARLRGARRPPHSYRANRGGLRARTRREGFQAAGLKGATEAEIRASKSAARSRLNAVSPFRAPPHQKGIFDASLMPISLSGVIF